MVIDAAVVGAGPAGLAASAALTDRGVEHVILERDRVAGTWRAQRWDSFRLNTAGWMNAMLGGQAQDAATGQEVVRRLERLADGRPIREGVRVTRLAPRATPGRWPPTTASCGPGRWWWPPATRTRPGSGPRPQASGRVAQLHTAAYRAPGQLPDGAVLVVESAQSGCQIAEDLRAGGRRVIWRPAPPAGCRSGTGTARKSLSGWPKGRLHGPAARRPARPVGHGRRHADHRSRAWPEPAGAGGRHHPGRAPGVGGEGAGRLRRQRGRQRRRRTPSPPASGR